MQKEIEIKLAPDEAAEESAIERQLSLALNIGIERIRGHKVLKRSIDARSRKVVYRMLIRVYIDELGMADSYIVNYQNVSSSKHVIIVGAGPAGLFAALQCIENGLKPIVLERGKDVKQRRRDLAAINKEGIVNTESNYCYGEGGAGTYSDGKLYTRSNKRGDINKVLQTFVQHGATDDILVDARPHIGTNKLPNIITSIRESILNAGGEVRFDQKVTDLLVEFGKIKGVEINGETHYKKSEPHKASVTGDTVGDPFKDTSGPSMNILIKLMSIVSLVIAPYIAVSSADIEPSTDVLKEIPITKKADSLGVNT
ncbi:MAG: FAD-binding protein, partial [Pedobacter sp.]